MSDLLKLAELPERLQNEARNAWERCDSVAAETCEQSAEAISSLLKLLQKVLDYYEGRKPFDFYRLHDDFDRSNQAFDAWQEIAAEIKSALNSDAPLSIGEGL